MSRPCIRALTALWLLAACGTQVEVEPVERGEAGESCEANEHCAEGLACVDLVCRAKAQVDAGTGEQDAQQALPTQSIEGESCGRRADCEAGLSCIDHQCRAVDDATDPLLGAPTRGGRGESCEASNDCVAGFGCIGGRCRERSFPFEATAKECFRVECLASEDCCADHQVDDPALCAELENECAQGVQADCNLFKNLCECNRLCDEGVCISGVECDTQADCGASGVLSCVDGRCAQCAGDADCNEDSHCVQGLCRSECEEDVDCPLLSVCDDHLCKEVGCESSRQCWFVTQNPLSRCEQGECVTACEDDTECAGALQGCVDGQCAFVGCETDTECRVALGLVSSGGGVARASCRMPE